MDFQNGLSVQKAIKVFNEFPQRIQDLARRRFFNHLTIINSKTKQIRTEYQNIATAKEVASAVRVLQQAHPDIRIKWNKNELKRLFGVLCLVATAALLLFLSDLSGDGTPDLLESLHHSPHPASSSSVESHHKAADPDFLEKALGLEDNAIEKAIGLPEHEIEKSIASDRTSPKRVEKPRQIEIQ